MIPPLRLAYFLFTNGENCANNDDINYLQQLERMSSPGYIWQNYFSDTFLDGHCTAISQLIFNAYVYFAHLNQYTGSAIGLAFIAIRLSIFFDLFYRNLGRQKWLYLILLSAILFGPNAASILTQGTFAITWQVALSASACALWAIFRLTGLRAIAIASSCIVIGSWTIATTLSIIPLVWWCAWHNKLLSKSATTCLGIATLCALLPYAILLPIGSHKSMTIFQFLKPIDLHILLSTLGRNFAPGTAWYCGHLMPAEILSMFGLSLFIALWAIIVFIYRKESVFRNKELFATEFSSALATSLFAIINLFLITTVRPVIYPWYGQISVWFWVGLVGMANCLLLLVPSNEKLKFGTSLLAGTTITTIVIFTMLSPSFEDKEFYLQSRSAAYLSALRNYQTPPPPGLLPPCALQAPAGLAKVLEQYHLPPFGKQDTVLFQGDCVIPGLVQFRNDDTRESKLYFIASDNKGIFTTTYYKRLNLALDGSMTVTWRVKIPADAKVAEFTTTLWQMAAAGKAGDETANILSISTASNEPLVYQVRPREKTKVAIDLLGHKGKIVDIVFSHRQLNPSTTILEVPKVEIVKE